MLQACGQHVQYGKHPLVLDGFNFNLDLDKFFQDESIFRWNNKDGFMLSSKDVVAERDSVMPGFVQYSTSSRSQQSPLAEYASVPFEDLGLLTDWDDEKVLMVCGLSNYKSAKDIMKIIGKLKKEYGTEPELQKGGFSSDHTLYLIYKTENKEVQFGMNLLDLDFIDWPERTYRGNSFWGNDEAEEEVPKQVMLTDEIEKSIEEKLKENDENTCFLFISTPEMAVVMNGQSGRSGFLVNYWRE
ncbi:hypothetical protein C5749_07745 [Sphingobacterium gobiense]|uniref:Uncharacterized protein n=2 Tax=Sphingobacterium gobiense TaxID=1382456 RepID=A0A2S9JV01_9SPHI|nr:hypothetical protein C5749_07745 [Sphingobacterium gobiense]